LGISGELAKAVRELGSYSYNAYGVSYFLGALYRFPGHLLLGARFSPALTIGPSAQPVAQDELPGFDRSVERPAQAGLGIGWIPNRFFKMGASLTYVGATSGTALLKDETISTGNTPTWVPRIGASYVIADYLNLKVEWALGAYYEASRLGGQPNRFHATTGLDVNPYFLNLGGGFDLSSGYRNLFIGIGIDLIRTARTFNIIPKDPTPPYNGTFPAPTKISAEGLPDALTRGEPKKSHPLSLRQAEKIAETVPENVAKKVSGKPTSVESKKKKKAPTKQGKKARPEKHPADKGNPTE
jgi:hypothetical protein